MLLGLLVIQETAVESTFAHRTEIPGKPKKAKTSHLCTGTCTW